MKTNDIPMGKSGGSGSARSVAPWILTLGALASTGGVGYLLHKRTGELSQARTQLTAAGNTQRAARVREEGCTRELAAERDRARATSEQLTAATQCADAAARELTAARTSFQTERGQLTAELEAVRARAQEATQLAARLRGAVGGDNGEADTEGERVTLQLIDRVLFRPGEAELTPAGVEVLRRVAEAISATPNRQIWVQGHTDVAPTPNRERFPTNWELSTARALSVVHYLQDEAHIAPNRLAAVGFSQYRPLARRAGARNRRIEIVLAPIEVRVASR